MAGGLGLSQNSASLTVGLDGALWIGFRLGGVMRLADGDVAAARWYGLEQGLPVGTVFDVRPDRQGQVWAGTSRGRFVLRGVPTAGDGPVAPQQRLGRQDGLSADRVLSAYEDRDGTLWFGTVNGLDRFRPAPAVTAPLPQGPDIGALAPLPEGAVLAGSVGQLPARLTADGPPQPLPGGQALVQRDGTMVGVAFTGDDGSAWLGGIPKLWHWAGGG